MAESQLSENAITRLSTTAGVDLSTGAITTLYTVPAGKSAIITNIIVRNPSESLSAVTSVSFGNNSSTYNNWDSGRTLAALTSSTLCIDLYPTLPSDSAVQSTTVCASGTDFCIKVTTGSSGKTATMDVFGILF